jgi:hypothetical protein
MFRISLQRDNHIRKYSLEARPGAGWESRLEEDAELRRRAQYHDWHRVERTLARLQEEVDALVDEGWVITGGREPVGR